MQLSISADTVIAPDLNPKRGPTICNSKKIVAELEERLIAGLLHCFLAKIVRHVSY